MLTRLCWTDGDGRNSWRRNANLSATGHQSSGEPVKTRASFFGVLTPEFRRGGLRVALPGPGLSGGPVAEPVSVRSAGWRCGRGRPGSGEGGRAHTDGRPEGDAVVSSVSDREFFARGTPSDDLRFRIPETSICKWRRNEEQMALGLWLRRRSIPEARAAWRHQRPDRLWAVNFPPVPLARRLVTRKGQPSPRASAGGACGNLKPDALRRLTARSQPDLKRGDVLSAPLEERSDP